MGQTTRLYRVNSAVELLGESSPGGGYVYRPALVELPADVAPGQTWQGAGSAGDTLDYRSSFRAEEAAGGCLRVDGELRYLSKAGQLGRVLSVDRTWCPGQGLVSSWHSFADIAEVTARVERPALPTPTTADGVVGWSTPQNWTAHPYGTVSIDPNFGQGSMNGAPWALNPVRTASGLVIRPLRGINDLVATTPKTLTSWTSVWRAHVGGTILTLSAFGDVVVVTTSERAVLAYSDTGLRLWRLELSELAPSAPVRADESSAVLVDLSGEVQRFDLATGVVGWRHNVGSDVNLAPVVGAGVAVVMDRGGTTTALDLDSGQRRWEVEVEGLAGVVRGDEVVILQDQTVHAFEVTDGTRRWVKPFLGTVADLAVFGDRILVATNSETLVLGAAGTLERRLAATLTLTVTRDHVVAWGPEEAVLLGGGLEELRRWALPGLTLAQQDRWVVATPTSVLLFAGDWTFQVWE